MNNIFFTNHKVRKIPINVHLPKSERAIFFETVAGKQFVDYATKIVNSQLMAAARCKRVNLKLPWHLGRELTVDDSLRLELAHKKGSIVGKITQVNLLVNGLQRVVEITLGCVIGKGNLAQASIKSCSDYAEEVWDDAVSSSNTLEGITYPNLNPRDLIQKVFVRNDANSQENHILMNQYPVRDNLAKVLAEVPTSINLTMRDLRTEKTLQRNFKIDLPVVMPPE